MRRRELISILGGAAMAAPQVAIAQTSSRTFRLGMLTPGPPLGVDSPNAKVLLSTLALHGYTLGRNLTYEARGAGGQNAKLAPLLQELKAGGVDAITLQHVDPDNVHADVGLRELLQDHLLHRTGAIEAARSRGGEDGEESPGISMLVEVLLQRLKGVLK